MRQSSQELALTRVPATAGIRTVAGVAAGCLLVGLAAQVRVPVPFTDVPMTLQTLAVLFVGFTLPAPSAVAAMLLYLGCGAAGLPMFSPGSGGIMGPTGGYLIGFAAAAWTISMLKGGPKAHVIRLVMAGAIGLGVVFAFGVGGRMLWFGGDFSFALATGFVPFAAKAVVEVLLAAVCVSSLRGWRNRRSAPNVV